MVQARPPALVYWNSEPRLKFKEQRLVLTTGLTFSTVSKVANHENGDCDGDHGVGDGDVSKVTQLDDGDLTDNMCMRG